jgi:membrane protein YdbS with pleckstrin-like domain
MPKIDFSQIPAPIRHAIYSFITGASLVIVSAINTANGVTAVSWHATLVEALNAGAVSAVAIVSALWVLPMNRRYGTGSADPANTEDPKSTDKV